MIIGKVGAEYRQYQGEPDDLTFRTATFEEEEICRNTEKKRKYLVIVYVFFIIAVLFFAYLLHLLGYWNIISAAFLSIFLIVAVVSLIRSILDARKSISYEVTDGILVYGFESSDGDSASSSGLYDHAAVWCPDQQVYLPSVRCSMNKAYIQKGDELLVVRGDRGNGRKPNYFVINKNLETARKDSKIWLTKLWG